MVIRNYKKILFLIPLLFLGWANFAHAVTWWRIDHIALSAIGFLIGAVLYTVGVIASLFVVIGGTLTNWALSMNAQLLSDRAVQIGWVVSRDLANLGFVLAIILIAFATILRWPNYTMKQLLWKLIVAALLVNFSLVIAGVFIDFSGVLTDFFLKKATGGDLNQIGPGLVDAMGAHRVFQQTEAVDTIEKSIAGMANDWAKFVNFIASLAFGVIFTIITAITLVSMAAMLYVRYIALVILLILAPLAWLMWIWPDLQKHWNKWWGEFMRWVFFAPGVAFFIYLAGATALNLKSPQPITPAVLGLDNLGLLMQNLGKNIAQFVSVLGILWGGMIVANSMGIAGAQVGMSVAKTVKGGLLGVTGYFGKRALTLGAGKDKEGKQKQSYAQRLATSFAGTRIPGATAVSSFLSNQIAGTQERVKKIVDERKNWTADQWSAHARRGSFLDQEDEAATVQALAKNNATTKIHGDESELEKQLGNLKDKGKENTPEYQQIEVRLKDLRERNETTTQNLMRAARATGTIKLILENRPDLGTEDEMKKALEKMTAREAAEKLSEAALKNKEVVALLKENQIEAITQRGTPAKREAMLKAINKIAEADPKHKLVSDVISNPALQDYIESATMPNLFKMVAAEKQRSEKRREKEQNREQRNKKAADFKSKRREEKNLRAQEENIERMMRENP